MARQRPGRHAELVDPGREKISALENDRLGKPPSRSSPILADMPLVDATPMMIPHMELGCGSIAADRLDGFVSRHDERVRGLAGHTGSPHRPRRSSRGQGDATSLVFELRRQPQDRQRHASPMHRQ
jgi:hypothetical protein